MRAFQPSPVQGKLREIDLQTLRKVGWYIRREIKPPPTPPHK